MRLVFVICVSCLLILASYNRSDHHAVARKLDANKESSSMEGTINNFFSSFEKKKNNNNNTLEEKRVVPTGPNPLHN